MILFYIYKRRAWNLPAEKTPEFGHNATRTGLDRIRSVHVKGSDSLSFKDYSISKMIFVGS
jgi:hypothetical protein